MSNEETLEQRRADYERKCAEHNSRCETCIKQSSFPITAERCGECTICRKLRMLEVEYSDVTGWSHETWKKYQTS